MYNQSRRQSFIQRLVFELPEWDPTVSQHELENLYSTVEHEDPLVAQVYISGWFTHRLRQQIWDYLETGLLERLKAEAPQHMLALAYEAHAREFERAAGITDVEVPSERQAEESETGSS